MKTTLRFILSLFLYLCFATLAHATEGGKLLASFPETVYFFAKNPKTSEIYASTNENILVIDPATQKITHTCPGRTSWINCIA